MTRAKGVVRAGGAAWMMCAALAWTWMAGPMAATVKAAANDGSPLGINLAEWSYWSSDQVFLDAMKGSSAWTGAKASEPWILLNPLDVDDAGNVRSLLPGQVAHNLLLREVEGHYLGGRYICTYEGEGHIDFHFAARTIKREPGRIEVTVDPMIEGGVRMQITAINAANPLRNIRFFHESHEELLKQGKVFRPDFLQRWSKFKVLRFMEWQLTNASKQVHWANRPRTTDQSQALGKGVAIEHMIELCNELNADGWFCIPHKATDDYIRQMAILIKSRLNSNLKAYIEYSNEIWNYGFEQSTWCAQQGLLHELVLNEGPNSLNARLRWQARRSVEGFKIFHEVFGTQKDRVVRVLAAQAAGLHTATEALNWQDTQQYIDTVAIAPYMHGDKTLEEMRAMSVEQIVDSVEGSLVEAGAWMSNYAQEMKRRNLPIICYEGGQHLAAHWDPGLTTKFIEANRHPRMKDIYLKYLEAWKSRGGGMCVLYNSTGRYSNWGSWGLMEYGDAEGEKSHKYLAATQFIEANRTTVEPPKVSVYDLMLQRLRALLELPGANRELILKLIQMIEARRDGSTTL